CVPTQIVTATDITHGKPHPEPYLKAAAALGFAPQECVVVEDAIAGVEAGRVAGARVIGFTTIFAAENLRAAGANWVVKNCSEMRLESSVPELRIRLNSRA
ncbi:MAG TPA: HAD-IA family hydrolase, partial [Terriglobales bacterium]|nr:HAD-IA family hydrolase [Terriglobales bacterium]